MDSNPEALVFDFDGVIANTEPLYWRAWCELLQAYNVPFAWADYCRIGRGIRDEEMLESLAKLVAASDVMAQIERRLPERREMVRQWKLDQPPIGDATVQLLKSLEGRTLGLVTSSDRADIELLLHGAGIADSFDACVFGEEITSHKPDPAPYLLIRQKLGISGGVVFEDSEAGLLSAMNAGFQTVHVSNPDYLPDLVRRVINGES
jgi:HAD superfamily hydrolase (TIGR01509 family)